jgi:hypothetical protein
MFNRLLLSCASLAIGAALAGPAFAAAPAADAAAADTEGSTIVVQGALQKAPSSATKSSLPIAETPSRSARSAARTLTIWGWPTSIRPCAMSRV